MVGMYEVVHVFVIGDDDVMRAAVTPSIVLLYGYIDVDVELLGYVVDVADDVAMFVAGIEGYPGEEPGVGAADPERAVPEFDAFEFKGRM